MFNCCSVAFLLFLRLSDCVLQMFAASCSLLQLTAIICNYLQRFTNNLQIFRRGQVRFEELDKLGDLRSFEQTMSGHLQLFAIFRSYPFPVCKDHPGAAQLRG